MAGGSGAGPSSMAVAQEKACSKAKGRRDASATFCPTKGQVGLKSTTPPAYPLSPIAFQAEKAKRKNVMDRRMKKWGWLILGVPVDIWDPRPSPPPPPMPRMRDPTKGKGAAPPVVPAEVSQGEESDAALAHWLQQEE